MPIYFAQFVVAEENLWFSSGEPPDVVSRRTVQHRVATQLFAASNAEEAYARAGEMVDGFSDAHCDGPGDKTHFRGVGIHDLDEVFLGDHSLSEALHEPYGVDAGVLRFDAAVPEVRPRSALSLFAKSGA